MKLIFPLLFLFFGCPLFAQLEINLDISFETFYDQEYVPLEDYTNLTEGLGAWDYFFYEEIELLHPIVIPGFEDRPINFLEIDGWGGMFLIYENWPDDPYDIFLISVAADEYFLSPLNDENNTDEGDILLFENEDVMIVEDRNVAFEEEMYSGDGSLISRANFQIEFHRNDMCFQLNYGPSSIGMDLQNFIEDYMVIGTAFGWFYEENFDGVWEEDGQGIYGIIADDPYDPIFHFLLLEFDEDPDDIFDLTINEFPGEGTVYRLCYNETTSTEDISLNKNNWQIYPNPVSDYLHISLPESYEVEGKNHQIQLMDVYGKLVLEESITDHQTISVQTLPSGVYFAQLKGRDNFEVKRVVIGR